MASRIGILDHHQAATDIPRRHVKKTAAALLVRRLLAVYITKHLIRMVEVRDMGKALPARQCSQARRPRRYEHHIEPKITPLTIANSEWLRYMQGL